jgi:hypothetical protein
MKSQSKALAIGVATALASILSPATAMATGTCYAFTHAGDNQIIATEDGDPPIVLRYIATSVGSINTDTEAKTLRHLKQTAYSLVGKATVLYDEECATTGPASCVTATNFLPQIRLMTTVDGTIIVGKALAGYTPVDVLDAPGAHMGVNVHFLRSFSGNSNVASGLDFAVGPVTMECTSSTTSPTPPYWACQVRAEVDAGYFPFFLQFAINGPIILDKLPANTARACSVFKDGRLVIEQPDT